MQTNRLSRRKFLRLGGLTIAGAAGSVLLAACAPAAPEVIEKEVEVTRIVEGETVVEKVVETVVETVVVAQPAAPDRKTVTALLVRFQPTEWLTRSAENPIVQNALRILARRFEEMQPEIKIELPTGLQFGSGADYGAWFAPRLASGDAPDLADPFHDELIQRGWCVPIEEQLAQPNPYAPDYPTWADIFWPNLMKSLIWADDHTYCAPIMGLFPHLEIGLVYNQEMMKEFGLEPPSTWTEEVELAKALRTSGNGLSPWPVEFGGTKLDTWPLGLQLLPSMLQDLAPQMDENADKFLDANEALGAFKAGLIGPLTSKYQTAYRMYKELGDQFIEGWSTSDTNQAFREGKIAMQYQNMPAFAGLFNDPNITFDIGFVPAPPVTAQDFEGANDPPEWTKGDGRVPGEQMTAINGADTSIVKDSVDAHGNFEETLSFLQWITTPENEAFIVNENQEYIPCAKDAQSGPLFRELASYRLPLWEYSIAWWGEGLFFDATQFNNYRKVLEAWFTGQIDEETCFARQQQEWEEGAARYEASLEEAE